MNPTRQAGNGTAGRAATALVVVAALFGISACAMSPTDLPLPGTRVSGESYSLEIEFTSVLNLPARSKVLADGSKVGVLRSVGIIGNPGTPKAVATVDIEAGARLPVGTRAELTQATVMGDLYISLTRPPADQSQEYLQNGDVIDLSHTEVTPQVEDLLAGIASLANGGTIEKLQRTINDANKAFPEQVEERDRGIEVLRAIVARFAGSQPSLDELIDGIASIAQTLNDEGPRLAFSLEVGPKRVTGAVSAFLGLTNVLGALGPNVVPIGELVIPNEDTLFSLVRVVNPLVASFSRLDSTAPDDLAKLDSIINSQLTPLVQNPSVNIVDFTTETGRGAAGADLTAATIDTLRMIGAVR